MATTSRLQTGPVSVIGYRCDAGPSDVPYPEVHGAHTVSFVRRGSFGYRVRGRSFDLVAGAFMVGRPGDEYRCSHEHHDAGDECLSFHLTPEAADEVGVNDAVWRAGAIAPRADLMVLGELAQAVADGRSDVAFDEIGLTLVARIGAALNAAGRPPRSSMPSPADRRRAVRAALWMDEHAPLDVSLADAAREAGLSAFHFLRVFSSVLAVTPHQYLVRARIRRAARLLAGGDRSVTDAAGAAGFADLSNFIRTFRRVTGESPSRWAAARFSKPAVR